MIIYSIYRVVNTVNGKVYIGFDSAWPKRKQTHINKSRSNKSQHFHFHQAIRKYGEECFVWEVIYQSKDCDHTLNKMESYFIKEYDSFRNGYNQTLGGQGSFGKLQSDENKNKQSEKRKELNKNSRWYNNGKINRFCSIPPGVEWSLGRLNQKPTTKNRRWYNNGFEQGMFITPPSNWILGMLPKK